MVEPLILYLVLFLPGAISGAPPPDMTAFSITRELFRIFVYNIPALALIWYLLLRQKSAGEWGVGVPRRGDLFSALIALPGLLLIGFAIYLVAPLFTSIPPGAGIGAPVNFPGWLALIFSCLSTGYLEESFFRFYLLVKLGELGVKNGTLVFISVVFFALCHMYEGPWGMLNAVLAGTLLALVFLQYRSLHGIALSHGLYNTFVYALGV